jgi:hypothetical protein
MLDRTNRTRCGLRNAVLWTGCVAALGIPRTLTSADAVILDLRGYAQEAEQWCWAATGQAVMGFLAPDLQSQVCQCRQAELQQTGITCCAPGSSCIPSDALDPRCNGPGWPDFGGYGFDFRTTCSPLPESEWEQCASDPLSWEELTHEIGAGRPVVFSHRPTSGPREGVVGHAMVAFGYATSREPAEDQRWVLMFDPKRVCRSSCKRTDPPCCEGDAWWIPYEDYRAPAGFSHWIDFFGIRRQSSSHIGGTSQRIPR